MDDSSPPGGPVALALINGQLREGPQQDFANFRVAHHPFRDGTFPLPQSHDLMALIRERIGSA